MTLYTAPGDVLHCAVIAAYAKIKLYYDVSNDCYTIATVLDPRFNILFYDQGGEVQDSVQAIKEVVHGVNKTFYHNEDDVSDPSPLAHMTMFSHLYPKKKKVSIEEFQSISEPSLGEVSPSDMLLWWKNNCKRYPNLSRMARYYLSIPGTSASSERLFSSGKEKQPDNTNMSSIY
jgi:hypothetical protein